MSSGTETTAVSRYVLWQRVTSPTSIVGSIEAPNLVTAANIARAMYGSFHVTEWEIATRAARVEAERMDLVADARAAEEQTR